MKRSNSVFDHVMVTVPMLSTLRSQYEMLFLFFGKASLVKENYSSARSDHYGYSEMSFK